jgi:hypothetical protein
MAIKLVAIDLDGTLLNTAHEVSKENKQAIQAAKDAGIKVVLCTGRPLKGMIHILQECNLLEEGDLGITYNGGLVQWTHTGKTVSQITHTKEDVQVAYQLSQKMGMPLNLIDLDHVYEPEYPKGRESLYSTIMKALPFKPIQMNKLPESLAINKMVMCWHQDELDEAIASIPSEYHERFTIMKSRPNLLEVLPKEVDKGKGLAMLAEKLGLAREEIMGIGDQENDLAMVEYAGLGVAMGNATEEVKHAAQFVTKTNDEYGVAYAIEKFVLK